MSALIDKVMVKRLLLIQKRLEGIQEYYKGQNKEDVVMELGQARVHIAEACKLIERTASSPHSPTATV
jgi:hypothetical protein